MFLAGRGTGKTRSGAEWVRSKVESGQAGRIALVAPTNFDARVTMVEGESGILNVCPPWNKPTFHPSKMEVHWPNGALAVLFSAEEPDRLNGPQFHFAWGDELGVWQNARHTYDMLSLGVRLGAYPQIVMTTTPKPARDYPEARAIIREFFDAAHLYAERRAVGEQYEPDEDESLVVLSTGSTYENAANLPASYLRKIRRDYEGTRLGREQIHATLVDEVEGALWGTHLIDPYRVREAPVLLRVVVGVDPAVKEVPDDDGTAIDLGKKAAPPGAETGIVVAGIDDRDPPHVYVLADYSRRASPATWAKLVIQAYYTHGATRVVAETNQGGALVQTNLRNFDRNIPFTGVHARQGKYTRAESIIGLYEQGRVHHVGLFNQLEDQMTTWVPGKESPDRVDALVHCLMELVGQPTNIWL